MVETAVKMSKKDLVTLQKSFDGLSDSLKRNIQRKILTAIGTSIKKEYRIRTPQASKTGSEKGWSKKITDRREPGKNRLKKAVVSKPSSKWKNKRQLAARGILGITAGYNYSRGDAKAANYAHLVNDGHVAVYWGRKGGGKVAGIHWQKEARQAAAAKSRAIVAAKAKQAIAAAVAKVAKKANR